jgi:hypothetical protein
VGKRRKPAQTEVVKKLTAVERPVAAFVAKEGL